MAGNVLPASAPNVSLESIVLGCRVGSSLDILKHKPHLAEGKKLDERQRAITIRQLLEHRSGWDRGVSFDAMFRPVEFAKMLGIQPPAGPSDVIRCMLGEPLDFAPGERYAYSNYGYCLLGRVIEQVTGKPYDDYVKAEVLAPLSIRTMRLGKTRLDDRQQDEVRYYTIRPTRAARFSPPMRGRMYRIRMAPGTWRRWTPTAAGWPRRPT